MDLLVFIKITCGVVVFTYILLDLFLFSLLFQTRRQAKRERRRKKEELEEWEAWKKRQGQDDGDAG